MKNISIVLNIVLLVAVGALYIIHFTSGDKADSTTSVTNESIANNGNLKVAYVNVDSILLKYKLAIELNESLTQKQTSMKTKLEKESLDFEKEAQIFQDKVQRGIFLTQQRAEEAQQKLMMRQQELQQLEYDYTNQLGREQQNMNAQLFGKITDYINTYNSPEKYQIILAHSLSSSILYGSDQLDITNDILIGLNDNYSENK